MIGMVLSLTAVWISPLLPLGISTSIYALHFIKAFAVSRSVASINCKASAGTPALARESRRDLVMAILERMASLPPFNMTLLPALKQRAKASAVTLGRDS